MRAPGPNALQLAIILIVGAGVLLWSAGRGVGIW